MPDLSTVVACPQPGCGAPVGVTLTRDGNGWALDATDAPFGCQSDAGAQLCWAEHAYLDVLEQRAIAAVGA